MLLERLIEIAPDMPVGYENQRFRAILTIGQDGRHIAFDVLDVDKARQEPTPKMARSNNAKAGLLIDTFVYAFGCGGLSYDDPKYTDDRHAAYKKTLGLIPNPAFKAMSLYLENPDRPLILPVSMALEPDQLAALESTAFDGPLLPKAKTPMAKLGKDGTSNPETMRSFAWSVHEARRHHPNPNPSVLTVPLTSDESILVLVEGLGRWWDGPDVMDLMYSKVQKKGGRRGQCALTLQDVELARLVPSSGACMLVCFNEKAFESYGQDQAYNSPVSLPVGHKIAAGLSHLLAHTRTSFSNTYALWAADGSVLDLATLFAKDRTVEEAKALVEGVKDDKTYCYLCLGENMKRWIVRDYQEIQGEELKRNLLEWVERSTITRKDGKDYLHQPWTTAAALYPSKSKAVANLCRDLFRFAILRTPPQRAFLTDVLRYLMPPSEGGTLSNSNTALALRWAFYGEVHMKKWDLLDEKTLDTVLPLLERAKDPEKMAFGLGYQFYYWERLEQRKSAPTKTLSERLWSQYLSNPRSTYLKIMDRFMTQPHGSRPEPTGLFLAKTKISARTEDFLSKFHIGVPGVTEGMGTTILIPTSLNETQRFYAVQGYEWAKMALNMHRAELNSRKAEKESVSA